MVWLTLIVLVRFVCRTPLVRPGPATRLMAAAGTVVCLCIRLENGIRQPVPIGTSMLVTTLLADILTRLMLRRPSMYVALIARLRL